MVLLPVLPGVMGGPVAKGFSALWDKCDEHQDKDDPRLRQRGLAQSTPLPQTSPGCPPTPASQGLLPPPSLHRPPHADTAQVRVQVEKRPDAERLRHDVAERRPLGRFQAEQTQNQLAQLRAVPVRDGREGTAHDLQYQRWQVL